LSDEKEGVVFLLWGKYAQDKGAVIDTKKHLVLKCKHPSPMSANQGGGLVINIFHRQILT
jgi:uracil-DNA glycosylase